VAAAEPVFRAGLVSTLAGSFSILAEAGTVREGQQLLSMHRPALSVIVLAPAFADSSVEGACAALIERHPTSATVALIQAGEHEAVRLASQYGARGIYETSIDPAALCATLLRVAQGEYDIQPSLVRYVIHQRGASPGGGGPATLTPRELSALQLLARGYTSKQIALILRTSPKAVDLVVERATHRLGASHRTQAVAMAMRQGLVT
jgi:DNA-binding NarL/FixJ family response regulator